MVRTTAYIAAIGFATYSVAVLGAIIGSGGFGSLEGRYDPAAAPMELTALVGGKEATAFWGESQRLRPECDYVGLEWWLEKNGRTAPVKVDTGRAIVREDGAFSFGPWFAEVDADEFNHTRAVVLHKCLWFPRGSTGLAGLINEYVPRWTTRSPFWR